MRTVFLRVIEADDKAAALLAAIGESTSDQASRRFEVDRESFSVVPRSPLAYWVGPTVLDCYRRFARFEADGRIARITNPVGDNDRFVRTWWEPGICARDHGREVDEQWVPLCKGGAFAPFYDDPHLVVRWNHIRGTYVGFIGTEHRPLEKPASVDCFFKPGITWPVRTAGPSFRIMPSGCVFGSKGPAAFDLEGGAESILALTAILNSRSFAALVGLQLARTHLAQSYEVGLIQATPVPTLDSEDQDRLAVLARKAWSLSRILDTCNETSHAFVLPAALVVDGEDLANRLCAWSKHLRRFEAEWSETREEIEEICFALYGIDGSEQQTISERYEREDKGESAGNGDSEDGSQGAVDLESRTNTVELAADLVSWMMGVGFGRFDIRLVTGERDQPSEPEPFDSLPDLSPGMLASNDGLRPNERPFNYPFAYSTSGIMVDDPGHRDDLAASVRAVFDAVFGERADTWWRDAARFLDPKGHEIGNWLRSDFFEYHLKLYSKSRRKAPIYWQLATPSARYSVWLYAHRLTRDSFFQIQNDVVGPKLAHEERKLASLVQEAGGSPSAKERKEIAAQESFVEELRAMLQEVKRVAPLWNPNLDDGVVLTMAPLWRLVPQHKSWQRELRSRWDELCAGKYDWAHVAMHLWPERAIPQCAKDRSLAIAHGLEDVFWVEDDGGKWTARSAPTQPLDALVRERTSPAVKAALASLLETPAPTSGGRGRPRKGPRASSTRGSR